MLFRSLLFDVDTYEKVVYQYGRNHVELVIKDGSIVVRGGQVQPSE